MIRVASLVVALLVACAVSTGGQTGGVATDLKVGPAVGSPLPDIIALDAHGSPRAVRSLAGSNGLVLMFFRSIGWCAYCRLQLVELQRAAPRLASRGFTAAAIGADDPRQLREFADRYGLTIPLLSDHDGTVAKTLGLLVPQAPGSAPQPPLPYEGVLTLNNHGVVVARYFEGMYHYRQTLASTLIRLGLGGEVRGTRIETPHLTAIVYASDEAAAPGTRVTLFVDVEPATGVHVYAAAPQLPALALEIVPQDFLIAHPLVLPPADVEFISLIGERLPMYERPFRLVRQASIVSSPESRARALSGDGVLDIVGRLDYRACDPERCFPPASIRTQWTTRLKKIDQN